MGTMLIDDVPSERLDQLIARANLRLAQRLRQQLDCCATHDLPESRQERVRLFLTTLPEKTQTPAPQTQAAQAVALQCEVWRAQGKVPGIIGAVGRPSQRERLPPTAPLPARGGPRADSLRGQGAPVVPAQGEPIAPRRAGAITTRQYSAKPLQAEALWTTQCRYCPGDQTPDSMSSAAVKAELPPLAVKGQVSAAPQTQAVTARLCLCRQVLKQDCGDPRDMPRARRTRDLPVGLARQALEAVLKQLSPPSDLGVKRLQGGGLRVCAGLQLRVHTCSCAAGLLTLHAGKGKKDRGGKGVRS